MQQIGFVQKFFVDFQPAWMGSVVDVQIEMEAGPCLKANDEILITLPLAATEVSRLVCDNVTQYFSNCSIISQDLEYNCNSQSGGVLVRLVVSQNISGNFSLSYTIPASSGIRLLSEQINGYSISLQIESSICGPMFSGISNVSSLLGNNDFCDVQISFVPAALYRPVALVINFDACVQVYDGDTLAIRLQNFSGESFNITLESSINVTWNSESKALQIVFPHLSLGEKIKVVTPASLYLPKDGISSLSNGIYLNFTSDRKTLSFFSQIKVQLVGSLKYIPEVKMMLSDNKIAISTSVFALMNLLPQDNLTIVLPTFAEVLQWPTLASNSIFSNVLWRSENQTLILTVGSVISSYTVADIVVRFNNSFLTLPPNGLVQVSNTIGLQLTSASGLSFDFFPLTFRGLGFEQSKITFSPPIAGTPTGMSIRLVAQSLIAKGQMIEIYLEAFTGSDVFDLLVTSDFTAPIFFCSWISQERALKCPIQQDIPASNPFTIRWPDYAGVALPEQGVNFYGPRMIVSVNTVMGSKIFQQQIQGFNPVGALKSAYIVRNETDFGTLWSFVFMAYMDIDSNSSFSIYFSSYNSGLDVCFDMVSSPTNFVQDGHIKNSTLSFKSITPVSRLSELKVTLLDPQVLEFLEAVRNSNYQILLSLLSSTGSVSDYSMEYQSISSRTNSSSSINTAQVSVRIQYENPYAGEETGILINLETNIPIHVGDELNIELVGFEGSQISNFSVVNDVGVVQCEGVWIRYRETIVHPLPDVSNETCWLNTSKNVTYVEWQNVTFWQLQYKIVNITTYKNVTNVLEFAVFNAEAEECEIVYKNESIVQKHFEMVNVTENVSVTVLQPVTKYFEDVQVSMCPQNNLTNISDDKVMTIQTLNRLSIKFVNNVTSGNSLQLRIPETAGIKLPTEGIAENEQALVAYLNSAQREVIYKADVMHSFPDVGSFRERVVELSGTKIYKELEGIYLRQRFTWNFSSVYVSNDRKSCIVSCGRYLSVSKDCNFAIGISCQDVVLRCKLDSEPILFANNQYQDNWEERNGSTWVSTKSISLVILLFVFDTF